MKLDSECEWRVMKMNCFGEVVGKDALQQSPVVCSVHSGCSDSTACYISPGRPLVNSAFLAYNSDVVMR